jgi:hypothetical protein
MKTLNRPMFRMGGPIKEGVMHGIREPKRKGGPTGTGLVGDQRYPKTGGREHHLLPLAPIGMAALRFLPAAWRGIRAARAYQPWAQNLGWAQRARDILLPRGGLRATMAPKGKGMGVGKAGPEQLLGGQAAGFRTGSFLRQNPILSASIAPQAAVAGYKGGKYLATEAAPAVGKAYVDALVPGESIFQEKTLEQNLDPNTVRAGKKPGRGDEGMYYKDPDAAKKLAAKRRDERVTNLLETMGYDAAKKDAVSKALIDASQIVSDRGTLDKKNITAELINPIIQATSKRLEKPEQLNEAVRLMLTKAEIEKEMNPLDSEAKRMQIAVAKKTLAGPNLKESILAASKDGPPMGESLQGLLRNQGVNSVVLPIKVGKNKDTLAVATEVIQNTWKNAATEPDKVVKPGIYVVRERIIEVKEDGSVNPLDV